MLQMGSLDPGRESASPQSQNGLFLPLSSKAAGSLGVSPSSLPTTLVHREAVGKSPDSEARQPWESWLHPSLASLSFATLTFSFLFCKKG